MYNYRANAAFDKYILLTLGKCGLGDKCKHEGLDIRKAHCCQNCKIPLHVLCAARTGDEDHIIFCGICDDNQPQKGKSQTSTRNQRSPSPNSSNPKPATSTTNTNERISTCVSGENEGEVAARHKKCSPHSVNTNSIPTIVTEESAQPNCLISTITQSDNGDWKFIQKDYFILKNQRIKIKEEEKSYERSNQKNN